MKVCNNCGNQVEDAANNCPYCGTPVNGGQNPYMNQNPQFGGAPNQQQYSQQSYNQYSASGYGDDYYGATDGQRFNSPVDYHEYLFAMFAYYSWIGFLISIIATPAEERSGYYKFHLNQALVLHLFTLLSPIPVIGWIWAIFMTVNYVIAVIGALQNKTKKATFMGSIHILK